MMTCFYCKTDVSFRVDGDNSIKIVYFVGVKGMWNTAPFFLVMRFLAIGLRFVFIALFFKYSESLYGEFSLIVTTITLGIYVLGLDFYMYAGREILKSYADYRLIWKKQMKFYLIVYLVLLPFFYLLFSLGFLSFNYIFLFFPLLVAEHLSFEIYRLLFTVKAPFWANLNLFFRNGFWVLFALIYYFLTGEMDIRAVLFFWLTGDVLAILCLWPVWRKKKLRFSDEIPDWGWMVKGLKISLPFFVGTLAFKMIEWSDRYMIDYFLDKKTLGVYAFFGNISVLVNTVVYTAVVSILYPVLVENIMQKNRPGFEEVFDSMKRKIIYYSMATVILLIVVLPLLLIFLGKENYLEQLDVFYWLTGAQVLLVFSYLYHFVLYGFQMDKILVWSAIWAALINMILNLIWIPVWGMKGAALSTFVSVAILMILKYYKARKLLKEF